jgi:hypothetical protein
MSCKLEDCPHMLAHMIIYMLHSVSGYICSSALAAQTTGIVDDIESLTWRTEIQWKKRAVIRSVEGNFPIRHFPPGIGTFYLNNNLNSVCCTLQSTTHDGMKQFLKVSSRFNWTRLSEAPIDCNWEDFHTEWVQTRKRTVEERLSHISFNLW